MAIEETSFRRYRFIVKTICEIFSALPMKYELASSTEEGEVEETGIPYYKSQLQYYYYPLTTKFIGRNSVPHFMNYKRESICSKLKKEIKADYSYLPFGLLESSKAFFDNNFLFVKDLEEDNAVLQLALKELRADYKEVKKLDKKNVGENRFDRFFQRFFFRREDQSSLIGDSVVKAFALEDRMLESLNNKNAFIFFRVASEKRSRGDIPAIGLAEKDVDKPSVTKYAFEEIFYSSVSFYEYLELCEGSVVRNYNSEEIRSYVCGNTMVMIFSGAVFKHNGVTRRLYNGVDCSKNTKIIFNKEGPALCDIQGRNSDNLKYLINLDLPEGDYAINDKKVYKICNEGIKVEFKDIVYDDFVRSRWE